MSFAGFNLFSEANTTNEQRLRDELSSSVTTSCKNSSSATNKIDVKGDLNMKHGAEIDQNVKLNSKCALTGITKLLQQKAIDQNAKSTSSTPATGLFNLSAMGITNTTNQTDISNIVNNSIKNEIGQQLNGLNDIKVGGDANIDGSKVSQGQKLVADAVLNASFIDKDWLKLTQKSESSINPYYLGAGILGMIVLVVLIYFLYKGGSKYVNARTGGFNRRGGRMQGMGMGMEMGPPGLTGGGRGGRGGRGGGKGVNYGPNYGQW